MLSSGGPSKSGNALFTATDLPRRIHLPSFLTQSYKTCLGSRLSWPHHWDRSQSKRAAQEGVRLPWPLCFQPPAEHCFAWAASGAITVPEESRSGRQRAGRVVHRHAHTSHRGKTEVKLMTSLKCSNPARQRKPGVQHPGLAERRPVSFPRVDATCCVTQSQSQLSTLFSVCLSFPFALPPAQQEDCQAHFTHPWMAFETLGREVLLR